MVSTIQFAASLQAAKRELADQFPSILPLCGQIFMCKIVSKLLSLSLFFVKHCPASYCVCKLKRYRELETFTQISVRLIQAGPETRSRFSVLFFFFLHWWQLISEVPNLCGGLISVRSGTSLGKVIFRVKFQRTKKSRCVPAQLQTLHSELDQLAPHKAFINVQRTEENFNIWKIKIGKLTFLEFYDERSDLTVPQAKPLSPGEVLGCTSPKLNPEDFQAIMYVANITNSLAICYFYILFRQN